MSTLSGNATKGEKGKKFQQLKINLCTANKPSEPEQQQHKSSIQRKQHGMTTLGKVPTARRPTNLPSEKSEHNGNDPSINLVPSGGAGWGNKQNETGPTTAPTMVPSTNPPPTNTPANNVSMSGTSQPVPHAQHYPPTPRMPLMAPPVGHVTVHHGPTDAKTWAMMTHGGDSLSPNFLAPQSPLFQQQFPSLSSNAEASSVSTLVTATTAQKPMASSIADTQYGPGPSLRPQTEGSWIQGGSRPQGAMGPAAGNPSVTVPAQARPMMPYPQHLGPDGVRNSLGPSGVGVVPGGPYPGPVMPPQHIMPPQYGGLMPPFMLRNAFPGGFPPNFQGSVKGVGPRPPYGPYLPPGPHAPAERFMQPPPTGANSTKRSYDDEDVKIRPIIKEEDLNQMASIGNDIGWAGHEDIDYNQKLKFSDDEDDDKNKENPIKTRNRNQTASKVGEKITNKKDSPEKEIQKNSENVKDKLFSSESRTIQEVKNAWQSRRTILAAQPAPRYQIPVGGRFEEDEEDWQERRRQKTHEMELIIQRAKERKEEEEKRFIESQQAAAMKLKKLEEQIFAAQRNNKENKQPYSNDRGDIDMLPEWEKEKFRVQQKISNENQSNDEIKKSQSTAAPVPVVKDASEFRELTQLVDRSNYVKKDTERENAPVNVSRSFSNNIPPRFQNLNRQNSSGLTSSSFTQNVDARRNNLMSQNQFLSKSNNNSNSGPNRPARLDSDSLSGKDRDWGQDEDRYAFEDHRDSERYQRDTTHDRDYGYEREDDRKYENKVNKDYDVKRKYYNEKDDHAADTYRDFDRDNSYSSKISERKNSANERDKVKYDGHHRYSENENQESDTKWRLHDDVADKPRYYAGSRSPRFSENDGHERKKSRDEGNYENLKSYNAERDREYYRKGDSYGRGDRESDREKESDRELFENKKDTGIDSKRDRDRDRDHDTKNDHDSYSGKDSSERKLNAYEERISSRNELRESRFHRESKDPLREESYMIQEERSYSWVGEADYDDKPPMRRDHYRGDHSDRYSHAHRHIPGPITREKLEAKELESESKRNLTTLVRSDRKIEIKKSDAEDKTNKDGSKEKVGGKSAASANTITTGKEDGGAEDKLSSQPKQEKQSGPPSVWTKDQQHHKKKEEESKPTHQVHSTNESSTTDNNNAFKDKGMISEDRKDSGKISSKPDDQTKTNEDRRNERRKSERTNKRDTRDARDTSRNWPRYPGYSSRGGNSYGGNARSEPKLRKSTRGPPSGGSKNTSQRRDKYSESDYSDEISGSGREDKNARGDREKTSRSVKSSTSKRYDRDDRSHRDDRNQDDRNRDYRMDDRDYGGNRSRNNRDNYYYVKPPQRGRGGFRNSVAGGAKRLDCYGPPPSKSPFGGQICYNEVSEKKSKSAAAKETSSNTADAMSDSKNGAATTTEKNKYSANGKSGGTRGGQHNNSDKGGWKKYDSVAGTKSPVLGSAQPLTEANEESFATASEGSDSDDNAQAQKNKQTLYRGTKRPGTVETSKPQRRNFSRSTSRKRYDNRKGGAVYPRKETAVPYNANKRTVAPPSASSKNTSVGNREHEKLGSETNTTTHNTKEMDAKNADKSHRDFADIQSTKKNIHSNSRKNVRTSGGGTLNNRNISSQDFPPRVTKPKNYSDSKMFGDHKDSKTFEISASIFKELGPPIPAPPPTVNAWDKPITNALRTDSPSTRAPSANTSVSGTSSTTTTVIVQEKSFVQITEQHSESSIQSSDILPPNSISAEKVTTKVLENLDGASPPVQTIIFENTNFKSGPSEMTSKSKYSNQLKNHRFDKDAKLDLLNTNDCCAVSSFGANSSSSELTNSKHDPLHIALSYKNEDVVDMKLDFTFDSEFSKLTDDNNKSTKAMELTHAMHMVQSSTDADLNFKIASVKKVWDGSLEHYDDKYDGGMVNTSTSFSPSFSSHGSDPNVGSCYVSAHVEASAHVQVDDVGALGHSEVVYSPVSQMQGVNSNYGSSSNCQTVVIKNDSSSSSSNVCKVKPQPQGCNTANMVGSVAQSNVMSTTQPPPPLSSPSYTFSCSSPQTNLNNNAAIAATALAQINFQAQYSNMPPGPSPPVLFNSTQTAAPTPNGIYQTFQIDNTQVATRTQFNQFPAYQLSSAIGQTSAFNQQSVFVQPPPSAPPPEIYSQQMPQYRLQAQPFGNTQQITNPSTVLISSSSNSLMSASIKPSNQPISAIGTKAGYQTAQTSQQIYIPYDPATQLLNQNHLFAGPQLLQRPGSNVVPGTSLQGSTSFYTTGSGAGQTGAYFQPGTNSGLQPQAGTAIGLSGFNGQSGAPSMGPASIQNYSSQLTQQYRSASTSYLKNSGNAGSISSDFGTGKTMNMQSQHDVMNPVFQTGSQMTSSKGRLQSGGKNVATVQQAMAQHSMSQSTYNYQTSNQMRNSGVATKGSQYPHPIQRPVSQGTNSGRGGNNASNASAPHRMPPTRNNAHQLVNHIQPPPPSVYYSAAPSGYVGGTGSSKLETSQLDTKTESNADSKLAESIKTINSKNATNTPAEKNAATNE